MTQHPAPLAEISPDRIAPNQDNPRLIFREDEMNELLESIREVGIRVPVSVFLDGKRYTLLDGERRWRCARKLNLSSIPAIVLPKPSRLENLLMMFNIHNVRVDWDLMPMALKLGDIRELLAREGKATTPKALAAVTGVRLATVRRALELLDLPRKFQRMLLSEAEKPRDQQRIKVDLFIEVYKSLHAVERHVPSVLRDVTPAAYVDAMVGKYLDGTVDNVVAYRNVSKIARAELAGGDKKKAAATVLRLVHQPNYGIGEAFEDTVKAAYDRRDVLTKARSLTASLRAIREPSRLDDTIGAALSTLKAEIARLLG
jgi:ParB family transcriptional regulator, chromosome partitioning protein